MFRGIDAISGTCFAVKKLQDALIQLNADEATLRAMHRAAAREVQVLSRFRHPHIVQLLGFATAGIDRCLVYELLSGGALDTALRDDERASQLSWRVRMRIASGVAKALNYLHNGGGGERVFHRDVKAANICLHADLSPALIDCGLAKHIVDSGGPQTSSGGRFGTPGYKCPRYEDNGNFDAKSEAYSFGIVLLELIVGQVQNEGRSLYTVFIEDEDEALEDAFDVRAGEWPTAVKNTLCTIARDCLDKYKKRCTLQAAVQCLVRLEREHCSPTVEDEQLAAVRTELAQLRAAADVAAAAAQQQQRSCTVCFCDYDLGEGLECTPPGGVAHFLCNDCLGNYVVDQVTIDGEEAKLRRFEQRQGVRCAMFIDPRAGQPLVPGACCAPAFTDAALAAHLPDATFASYFRAKTKVAEQRIELQAKLNAAAEVARLQAELARRDEDQRAAQVRTHIIEKILNPSCPRCGQAFIDFEGCFALSCSRVGCTLPPHGFCAYCLHDAQGDAHAHVANCQYNIAPGRNVFASIQVFHEAQRRRCQRTLRQYLATLDHRSQERALCDCARELRDLRVEL